MLGYVSLRVLSLPFPIFLGGIGAGVVIDLGHTLCFRWNLMRLFMLTIQLREGKEGKIKAGDAIV